jgi:hypothetical protein
MNDIIVKSDKVTLMIEWPATTDQEILNAIRNARELSQLIEGSKASEQINENETA